MSTATIAPVNPMAAEGKETVMNVMRRDRANFTRMVEDPKNCMRAAAPVQTAMATMAFLIVCRPLTPVSSPPT